MKSVEQFKNIGENNKVPPVVYAVRETSTNKTIPKITSLSAVNPVQEEDEELSPKTKVNCLKKICNPKQCQRIDKTEAAVFILGIGFVLLIVRFYLLLFHTDYTVGDSNNRDEEDSNEIEEEICSVVKIGEVINPNDYVQLIFSACPFKFGLNSFTEAATRISAIINQTELTQITLGADASFNDVCGNPLEDDVIFPAGFTFDSLVIIVNTVDIDGQGGILAQAGPCAVSEEDLPILGLMTFDNVDVFALAEDGTLDDVVMHEMLHVTGLGTLWNFNRNLLQDPVFDAAGNFNANAQPRFVGASGVSEFEDLGGNNRNGVPVEDGIINGQRVLDANNGRGSIDGHWDIDNFDNELMVFAIDANDAEHPLSRLTIGSLEDLGYEVDFNQADNFSVSAVVSLDKGNLRSSIASGKKGYVDLSNDLSKMPVKRASEVFN
eukprot:snap_masked-scaffold_25-processed-gene-4.24-mRNA-1 protein AED:1.00 eAED:1.00 QI:0/0/0/0/1/1/3/0/435